MQIQLKQSEIIAALKQYIANQGIVIAGKTVDIRFTAGRGQTGLSADISIEDNADFLGGQKFDEEFAKTPPALSVVKSETPVAEVQEAEASEENTPPFDGGQPVEAEAKKVTTSLFGS